MPNWVQNTICVKGNEKQILDFINLGLLGSKLAPATDVEEGFDRLIDKGRNKTSKVTKKGNVVVTYDKRLTMGTFFPMPTTFLKTDTTNYAKDFPKVAAYQKRKFGVVGWYDYNCFKRFGCKWDAQLCKPSISQARLTKKYVISFEVETPWSYPQLWMEQIKAKTGCEVYIASIEESNMWLFWSEVDGDEHSYSPKLEEKAKELADDDYDGYWEFRENLYECAVSDCVCEVCELLQ